MTLTEWQKNGWLRPHNSSRNEIEGLFSIVDRDLNDAISKDLSCDWKWLAKHHRNLVPQDLS